MGDSQDAQADHLGLITGRTVREVVKIWDSERKLGDHSLAHLVSVKNRRLEMGATDSSIGRGKALKSVIAEQVERLRPTGPQNWHDAHWHPYLIVTLGFIRKSPNYTTKADVMQQLGYVKERDFYRVQEQAFASVATYLEDLERQQESGTDANVHVPFMSPPRPPHPILGRQSLLQRLKTHLIPGSGVVLFGVPGIGKTALAIELAHDKDLQAVFADGVLWAGLGPKGTVYDQIGQWMLELGVPRTQLSRLRTLDERVQAVQAKLGTCQMLLVVDDAWKATEALALLLANPNCAWVVTTHVVDVAAAFPPDRVVEVGELTTDDAVEILTSFAPTAIKHDPLTPQLLAEAAGGWPQVLVVIGAYLRRESASNRKRRIEAAFQRLLRPDVRLHLPGTVVPRSRPGVPPTAQLSPADVLKITDKALPPTTQQALRALAVLPAKPSSFNEVIAAEIAGVPVETIDELYDVGLLENAGSDRYSMHSIVRQYAGEELDASALLRFVTWAVRYIDQHQKDYSSLDRETNNLVEALEVAFEHEYMTLFVNGVNTAYMWLYGRGLYQDLETQLNRTYTIVERQGDVATQLALLLKLQDVANRLGDYERIVILSQTGFDLVEQLQDEDSRIQILSNLATVEIQRGEYDSARVHLKQALIAAEKINNDVAINGVHTVFGTLELNLGNYPAAERHYQAGLTGSRRLNDVGGISAHLQGIAVVAGNQGQFDVAEVALMESLQIARKFQHVHRLTDVLGNLGWVVASLGQYERAAEYLIEGLDLVRSTEDRENTSFLLMNLGWVYINLNYFEKAEECFQEGLRLARDLQYVWLITLHLMEWGELYLKRQQWPEAKGVFDEALGNAQKTNNREHFATARWGQARMYAGMGDLSTAIKLATESYQVFMSINHIKAKEVELWLKQQGAAT